MKFILLVAMSIFSIFSSVQAIELGSPAPEISSVDENNTPVQFSDFYKKGPTLVYFYPKADTPGCTKEACDLRDSYETLQKRGLQILGVSSDKPDSQKKFKDKHRLPFLLVADHEGTVAKAYGVPNLLGIPKRQSFLIHEGKVVWMNLNVSPGKHVEEVGKALDAIKK